MTFSVRQPEQTGSDLILENLGKAIGGGFEAGVSTGLQNQLKQFQERKASRQKLPGVFDKYSRSYEYDKSIDPETRRKLFKNAEELIDEGYDPLGAVTSVYDRYLADLEKETPISAGDQEEKPGFLEKFGGAAFNLPKIKEFLAEKQTPEGPSRGRSLLSAPLKGALDVAENIPFSPKMIAHLASGQLGQPSPLAKFLPTQDRPAERILETAGRVAPLAFAGPGSVPLALAEIGTAAAGREIAHQLGAPEIVQDLAEMAGFSLPGLSKLALGKIGNVVRSKGIRPPEVKQLTFKPGEVPPSSPGPVTGEEVLDSFSKIVNDSVKNLGERGITLEQINAGEPRAINELQKEASKLSDLYKKSDKMNLKAFEKQRQDIIKKIPESPLEKYYAPEKISTPTPETIAKNELRVKPLETLIKQNERRARDLQYQILSADETLRSQKLSPREIELIESTRASNALAHQRAMNEIKNARFEIKYGRAPQTSEQIQAQIDKSFDELRAGIKDPSSKKVEAFRKGFERDKHLIDEAQKLINRGEIPGPTVFDEYTKIHEQYLKSYDDLIKELTDFIKENKGKPRFGPRVKRAEELNDLIKNTKKLGKAKLEIQKDKRRVQGLLEKPSGAFYKNMLKDLRKDVDAFQKDYFKWSKIAEGPEKKVAELGKKTIKPFPEIAKKEFKRQTLPPKEPPKVPKKFTEVEIRDAASSAEQAAKNPTDQNINTAAEKSGMSKEEYRDYFKKISEKVKKAGEDIKSGKASPQIEKDIFKDFYNKFKKLKGWQQALIGGTLIGTIQGLGEEYLGWKVSRGELGLLGLKGLYHTSAIGNPVYRFIRDHFNESAASELKKKRGNPKEFNAYHQKLREKYGDTRANKIRKMAIQP